MFALTRFLMILTVTALGWCVVIVGARFGVLMSIATIVFVVRMAAKRVTSSLTTLGSARWAVAKELRRAGMLGAKNGMILGRLIDGEKPAVVPSLIGLLNPFVGSRDACRQMFSALRRKPCQKADLVRLPNAVHTAVFAPTGVGKGVSCVIPHLLNCPESTVVVDFKGENYQLTAEHRRNAFGHRIVVLDPFRMVTDAPDSLNPLDSINRDSPHGIDDVRDLSESLVIRTGQEKEPHWADSAEVFIGGIASAVVQFGGPEDRSLQTVRTVLTNPANMQHVIKRLCESQDWGGMLARMGDQLTQFKEKELGSTLTTTNRFLRFLDTLAVAESTSSSSFDINELRDGKMTIYLVLPPQHARAQSPLLRMWIGACLRSVVRGGLQETNKVHMILDEAASLGALQSLNDAVDKYRGYGVRLQFYYQSMGQLKACFPDGQDLTLLSNVTQIFFGVNDNTTADYVSARLGEKTIVVDSGGTNTGASLSHSNHDDHANKSTSWGGSANWGQQARKLLKSEEVMAQDARTAITFAPNMPPVRTTLIRFYEEAGFSRWRRFKEGAAMSALAVMLLMATLFLALVLSVANSENVSQREVWDGFHGQDQGNGWGGAQ